MEDKQIQKIKDMLYEEYKFLGMSKENMMMIFDEIYLEHVNDFICIKGNYDREFNASFERKCLKKIKKIASNLIIKDEEQILLKQLVLENLTCEINADEIKKMLEPFAKIFNEEQMISLFLVINQVVTKELTLSNNFDKSRQTAISNNGSKERDHVYANYIMSNPNIHQYLIDISQYPLLKNKEMSKYFHSYNEGLSAGEKAVSRDILIKSNLRLVVSIAKQYKGMPFLDIVQEGNIGLIKAVENFDVNKGYKFSTYATWWIRNSITRAISLKTRLIKVPINISEQLKKLVAIKEKYSIQLGKNPTLQELAQEMNCSVEHINCLFSIPQDTISLEVVSDIIDIDNSLLLHDKNIKDFDENIITAELSKNLLTFLDNVESLTKREKEAINLRFGLEDGNGKTLEEVGKNYNLTRERIRQIEKKSLTKLRQTPKIGRFSVYLDCPEKALQYLKEMQLKDNPKTKSNQKIKNRS
ncbi:MAG: sigma-70 family RNA polymerase sigma factor [Bacilli bacterium]